VKNAAGGAKFAGWFHCAVTVCSWTIRDHEVSFSTAPAAVEREPAGSPEPQLHTRGGIYG